MRGSVIKRGKSWSVVVDLGRDPETGQRQRRWHSGYRTRKEAEVARTEILRQLDTGSYTDPSKLTVREYLLDEWLPARKPRSGGGARSRGQLGVQTWDAYRTDLDRYVIPRLGGMVLQQLRPTHLNRLYDQLESTGGRSGSGLAAKTIKNVHGIVHKALADAVKQGLLPRNPADAVEPPRAERASTDVWSVEQLRVFLAHVDADRLYAAWLLFATTGMRRGEVAGLAWSDLDLDAGTATVDWTLGTVAGHPVWKPRPKSKAGRRTMSLDPITVEALRVHRRRQLEERIAAGPAWQERAYDAHRQYREGVVFVWPDGSLINPNRLTTWFRGHCAAAGLPAIRLHDVRHTYATAGLANATGWHEVKVISERLGHASVGITLDTYSHVLPARDRETADTLARLILGGEAL